MCTNDMTRKLKENRAFTLQEMLIALAITVILLGISIVSIHNFTNTLKMSELDNCAKSIYMQMQNQLAIMEVEGGLPTFYDDIKQGYSERILKTKPQDYASEDRAWENLFYFYKGDDIIKDIVGDYVKELGGSFLVELNPQTGDVYGVFYWENAETSDYITLIASLSGRDKQTRTEQKIGYYGGTTTGSTILSKDFQLGQRFEIINGEELYVKISYDYSNRLIQNFASSLTIHYTMTDEHGNVVSGTVPKDNVKIEERLEIYCLLDSAEPGYGFSDIMSGLGIVPGDDITITVYSVFSQDAYYCESQVESVTTNSLFQQKQMIDGATEIQVSTLRHLKNLDENYYTHEGKSKIHVLQSGDINMNSEAFAWYQGRYKGAETNVEQPVLSIYPIQNELISYVQGNGYEIQNLYIVGRGNNVGLFPTAENVTFENLKLVDTVVAASEYENVGALVGQATNCTIKNCGVYLSTFFIENGSKQYYNQILNNTYGTEMEKRCQSLTVIGKNQVGGLLGKTSGTTITESYAAIGVIGKSNVGGLIGAAVEATVIKDSYSSGAVSGDIYAIGGFIGLASDISVENAYSTSDIYGEDCFGGFLGKTVGSTYQNCTSYGEVLNRTGQKNFSGIDAGGFVCNEGNVNNTYRECKYLRQRTYNMGNGFKEPAGMFETYGILAKEGGKLAVGNSYPYVGTLLYKAFPFEKVVEHHHGDWPIQFIINTSLVYYEKYANGTYGYYGVMTLSDGDDGVSQDDYVWVLNSLQDMECKEDGYALLSMYYLTSFDYQLDIGTSGNIDLQGTLQVDDDYGSDKAVLLRQQGFLEFKAYDAVSGGADYSVDYSQREVQDVFTISGMYLYQLPYELQCTNRYNVVNFYDKFTVHNGYSIGNTETPVVNNVSFFYCPHFAKTAVNPGIDGASNAQLNNPEIVHVRSARQLNALGRVPYYWNKEGGLADTMHFVQETDINFGTYVKNYCGMEFDLMDTSKPYANQPIGMPDLEGTYKQFRNIYDGRCHKIIDFNLETDRQFAGLFGEIQGAELKNIVMTVSKKGAGIITSSYHPTEGNKRAGLGALVGLVYQGSNVVHNCTAAGYEIIYDLKAVPSGVAGAQQPKGIAVGGLIGLSMSDMSNCSATNDVKLIVNASYDKNGAVFLGGLAGSFYYGTIENVYSGGSIDVQVNGDNEIYRLRIGGLCPGFMYTSYASFDEDDEVTYKNIYTYTEISDSIWTYNSQLDGNGVFDHLIPAVGRMSWNKNGQGNTHCLGAVSVPEGYIAYYLDSIYEPHLSRIDEDSAVWDYFVTHRCDDNRTFLGIKKELGKTCDKVSFEVLSNLDAMPNEQMRHEAMHSYAFDKMLEGETYPFPAVIMDADGNYVHYGDWPVQ